MTDKKRFNIWHNVFRALMNIESEDCGYDHNNPIPQSDVDDIIRETERITNKVYPIYTERSDAPLWLSRQLKNRDWLLEMGDL